MIFSVVSLWKLTFWRTTKNRSVNGSRTGAIRALEPLARLLRVMLCSGERSFWLELCILHPLRRGHIRIDPNVEPRHSNRRDRASME